MLFQGIDDTRLPKELIRARQDFQKKLLKNPKLGYLLLVDPVRAFADAGIKLNTETRKYLRRTNPGFPYGNKKLYKGVKAGKIRLPWITSVKFHLETENPKEHGR